MENSMYQECLLHVNFTLSLKVKEKLQRYGTAPQRKSEYIPSVKKLQLPSVIKVLIITNVILH